MSHTRRSRSRHGGSRARGRDVAASSSGSGSGGGGQASRASTPGLGGRDKAGAGAGGGARVVGAGYKFRLTELPRNTAPITRTSQAAHHMAELLAQMHEVDLFDSLRPWLKHEKIFYEHEDAETAPIRLGASSLPALGRAGGRQRG